MGSYQKVDGVDLSVDWVKGMSKKQFLKNAQVLALFKGRENTLPTVYEIITGRKSGSAPEPVSDDTNSDAAPQSDTQVSE